MQVFIHNFSLQWDFFLFFTSVKEYVPDSYSNKPAEMVNVIVICSSALKCVDVRCARMLFLHEMKNYVMDKNHTHTQKLFS